MKAFDTKLSHGPHVGRGLESPGVGYKRVIWIIISYFFCFYLSAAAIDSL